MTSEKTIIKLLETIVEKQNEFLRIISSITGSQLKKPSAEERKRYIEYVRKRIYG